MSSQPLTSPCTVHFLEPRRLLAVHVPDVSWGDAGFQGVPGPAYLAIPASNGKVTVLERLADYKGLRFHRLNADGSTDTSFGAGGYGPTMAFGFVDVYSAIEQPDGKVLVTGGDNLFVARFNADGTVDTGFGTDGIARPTELAQGSQPTRPLGGLAMQSDGKIIAAGYISLQLPDHNANFTALYRFNADGTVDTTFGEQGRIVVDTENIQPEALATRSDDRIFLAASHGTLVQYTPDGLLDMSFSSDGSTDIGPEILQTIYMGDETIRSVLPLDNGQTLIGGASFEVAGMPGGEWISGLPIIMRLNADGSADTTFADQGTFHYIWGGGSASSYEPITTIKLDADGRIFAAGQRVEGEFRLYVLTADGALDSNYTEGGLVAASNEFYANDIALLSDGSVLVTGRGAGQTGSLARVSEPAVITLGANGVVYLRGTESADTISISPSGANVTVTVNAESQSFTTGEVTSCQIEGFAGDDVITVAVGIDAVVNPGDGNDSVTTSIGNDKITEPEMPSGRDTIRSSDGNDTIYTGDGDDRVIAGSGEMNINTWIGDDQVTVGDGKMTIELSSGNDRLTTGWLTAGSRVLGGYGNDRITTVGSVYIQAGAGYKSLKWNPGLPDDDTVFASGGRIHVDLDGGNNTCVVSSRFGCRIGGGVGNDSIVTGSGADHIDPIGGNDTVYSNGGDDVIFQLTDTDVVHAGSGDDVVDGGRRGISLNPTIYGESGNDRLYARYGGTIYGGSGNDDIGGNRLLGAYPIDPSITMIAHGQAGNDTLTGSDGRDQLYGGDGNDWLRGGMSGDKLFGGDGDDKLSGNGGGDMIQGGFGVDLLFGNAGDDRLYATDDLADTVDGGDGNDGCGADLIDTLLSTEWSM